MKKENSTNPDVGSEPLSPEEITPEMIDAGIDAIIESDFGFSDHVGEELGDIAKRIYLAMRVAASLK